jgi:tRNA nucleotidyltransferase/poly(A) polymerase
MKERITKAEGIGLFGPHPSEGLGLGLPFGGGQGLPHSTNLPSSHQGHGGNLTEGPQSGNSTSDHGLETQPFNKTLGGFTVEELISNIKALMKIKSPESMQQATFLQDVLQDKMQRLKAARRALDAHVMIKDASIIRNLKSDPFTQALFEEHNVPLDRLDEADLPVEITHFSLHNLVHKLAKGHPHIDVLKKNRKPLTDKERKEVMDAGAVWHGPGGKETPAIWKAKVGDRVWYVCSTHRAYQCKKTLPQAIKAFELIKTTAQVAQSIRTKQAQDLPETYDRSEYFRQSQQQIREIYDQFEQQLHTAKSVDEMLSIVQNLVANTQGLAQRVDVSLFGKSEKAGHILEAFIDYGMREFANIVREAIQRHAPAPVEGKLTAQSFYNFYAATLLTPYLESAPSVVIKTVIDTIEGFIRTLLSIAKFESHQEVISILSASVLMTSYQMETSRAEGATNISTKAAMPAFIQLGQYLQQAYGGVDKFLEAVQQKTLSPDVLANLFEKILRISAYGGPPWANIVRETAKLEQMLPVIPQNAREVAAQTDYVIDLEHNSNLFLSNYVNIEKAVDLPPMSTLKNFLDQKTEEWDWGFFKETAPQFYNMYQQLKRFHRAQKLFRKLFGQTAQPIKGRCPESGAIRYMSQTDLVQNDYKADCPEGKRRLKDQKSVSIEEYRKHKKKRKRKKKSSLKRFTRYADTTKGQIQENVQGVMRALKNQDWDTARQRYLMLSPEHQSWFAGKIRETFPEQAPYILEGKLPQAQEKPREPQFSQLEQSAPSDEEVAEALKQREMGSGAFALTVSQQLDAKMVYEDREDGRRIYGLWKQEDGEMLFNVHFYVVPQWKAIQLTYYKVSPTIKRIHDPDLKETEDVKALRKKYLNPMQVLTQEAKRYGYSVQVPSMEVMMQEANIKGFTKRAQEGEIKFNEKEQRIIDAVKSAAEDLDINTYLVGGAVRDRLLGKRNVDLDFMVEDRAEDLVAYLAEKYSTEMPIQYDRSKALMITLDGETLDFINAERLFQPLKKEEALEGEEEFTTSFDDAYRRDLTINTLMYDLREGELLDPTGKGLRDLRNKQINTVIDPFIKFKIHAPDMLRALRFAATLGFDLGPNMIEAMRENVERVRPRDKGGDISNRRIRKELRKAIDDPQHWAELRKLLTEVGLDAILVDDIKDVQEDFIGGIDYHLEEKGMTRIKGLTKVGGIFDFWKKREKGTPTKEQRMRYITEQIDDVLAKTPRGKHENIVNQMLGEWKIAQNMPEYAYIMSLLKHYRPSKHSPSGRTKRDIWIG